MTQVDGSNEAYKQEQAWNDIQNSSGEHDISWPKYSETIVQDKFW
jgi:hypothetical protein